MKKILSILLATALLAGFGAVTAFAVDYTVTFNRGDDPLGVVTNVPGSQTKTVGTNLTLTTQIPIREGYKFMGWATSPTYTTGLKLYPAGGTYDSDALVPVTLYAIWQYNLCFVTFNGNPPAAGAIVTGLPATNPVQKLKDEQLPLSSVGSPACDGYTFMGWSTSATGIVEFSASGYCSDDNDLTLYAVWEADSFTVAFNANSPGGTVTGMPNPLTKTKDRGVPLFITEEPEVDNDNYTFNGWATSPTGAATIAPGGSYTANAAATLYAVWKGRDITVVYDANGGVGTMANSTFEYGKATPLRTNTFTYPLAAFLGWATTPTGAKAYNNGDSATLRPADDADGNPVSTVTLYAIWQLPSKTALIKLIEDVDKLNSWKYTAETWANLQKFLNDGGVMNNVTVRAARAVAADPNASQQDIDNAYSALNRAKLNLEDEKLVGIGNLTTKYKSSLPNWLLFLFAFGWIWMWFGK